MSDPRVVVIAKVTVKPEKLASFKPAWAEFMRGVKTEPNCIYFNVAVSEDETVYWMYEEYTSQAGLDEHEASAHYKKFNALAGDSGESFWAEKPEVSKTWKPYF